MDAVEAWTARVLAGTPSLRRDVLGPGSGEAIARILAAALAAVDPRVAVLHHVHRLIKPRGQAAVVGEFVFDLSADPLAPAEAEHGRIFIFGAGKASAAMAAALLERFGERVAGGVVIVKHPPPPQLEFGPVEWVLGDHPIPGQQTAQATARLRARASEVGPRDLVLCPISGGASALLSEARIDAASLATLTTELLARDVSIQAINKLRRRFDALKAGGLARLLAPATVVGLIISDVVGDDLALVGSGPTVYPSEREADEYAALLTELGDRLLELPDSLRAMLEQPPALHERPDREGGGHDVHQVLLARNGDARAAACRAARAEGFDSIVLLPALGGLAVDEGRRLGRLLAALPADLPVGLPACVVTGGETTVELHGVAGPDTPVGGRNGELALAAVEALDGVDGVALVSLASDGEDGSTDAAGAVVTGAAAEQLRAAGLDVTAALARHDSYALLARLDALIRIGPTGTNVCDLAVLLRDTIRP